MLFEKKWDKNAIEINPEANEFVKNLGINCHKSIKDFKNNYFQRRTKPKGPKINNRIFSPEVQVISSQGENLGVLKKKLSKV